MIAFVLLAALAGTQDFHTGPSQTPGNAERLQANEALAAHDYARALKLLEPLASQHPQDARLLYDVGSAQDALDQPDKAETHYRAAIADDAAFLEPRVALGLLLARSGRLEDARTALLAAVGVAGDKTLQARAYRALARVDRQAHPAEALDALLAALKLSPETPDDTLFAAELAAQTGGTGDAEAAYRRLLAARPNDPEAAAALGHLLVQQKRWADAETVLLPALQAHPADPGLVVQLASTYAGEGKAADALPLVQRLHAASPMDANVSRLLAGLDLDAKDYAAAEPLLAALRKHNPGDPTLADEQADALIHLKRFADAEQLLAPLIATPSLWPTPASLADAAGHLAFAASENNNPAVTLRALDVRATVAPPSPPVLFLSAISHDKLHQVKAAQTAYKAFLAASNGKNPDEEFEAQHRLIALEHMK